MEGLRHAAVQSSRQNKDGFLDATEFKQVGAAEPILADAEMAYFDDDRDNRVSRKEFVDKPNQLFVRYDVNHDCRVTAQEIQNAGRPPQASPVRGGERQPPR